MATIIVTQPALTQPIRYSPLQQPSPLPISNQQSQTKNLIRNKQYNILMNTPELEQKTLTLELNSNPNRSLLRIRKVSHSTKISMKSPALNTYIQKLRIIYFLVFTQNYQSIWDSSKTDFQNQQQKTEQLKWKNAYHQIRLACYQDCVDQLDMKYLAEFFQFLDYDLQHKLQNHQNSPKHSNQQCTQQAIQKNMVICQLNKYPIIDELLTKMLIAMIKSICQPVSLDDNYNITKLVMQKLNLDICFISNWQFILMGIKVQIGKDMFSIDNNLNNYFNAIINNLQQQNKLLHDPLLSQYGLDVSCVTIPDSNVFDKMDQSFVTHLLQFLPHQPHQLKCQISDIVSQNKDVSVSIEENPLHQNLTKQQGNANEDIKAMLISQQNKEPLQQLQGQTPILSQSIQNQQYNLIEQPQNQQISAKQQPHPQLEQQAQLSQYNLNHSQTTNPLDSLQTHNQTCIQYELDHHQYTVLQTAQQTLTINEYPSNTIQKQQRQQSKGSVFQTASQRDESQSFLLENQYKSAKESANVEINIQHNDKSFHEVCKDIEKILNNINQCILKSSLELETKQQSTLHKINHNKSPVFLKDKIQHKVEHTEMPQFVIPDLIKRKSKQPNFPNFLAKRPYKSIKEEQKVNTSPLRKDGTHHLHPQLLRQNQLQLQQPILIPPPKIWTEARFKPHTTSFEVLHPQVYVKNNIINHKTRSRSSFKAKRQGITITQSKPIFNHQGHNRNL